jgi:hypothetical protein
MAREHILRGINYGRLATLPSTFETIGTFTTAGTTLAVGGRAWDDVSSYFSGSQTIYLGYTVPLDYNAMEFRFQGETDGDSNVVEIWGARGHDYFTLLATLTTTVGTQVGDDDEDLFVDTIVVTNEGLPKAGVVVDSGNDRICRYVVDMVGYSKLLLIATTLNSDALKVEGAGY